MFEFFKHKKAQKEAQENIRRIQEESRALVKEMNDEHARWQAEMDEIPKRREKELADALRLSPGSEKYRLPVQQTDATVHTLNITEFSKIATTRYVAFDLETTGVRPTADEIVEIGAVLVENGVATKEYHQLVNPGRPMPPDAYAVNRISDDMLVGQPKIHQVLPSFLSFVGDDVLVAHNAAFDLRFIAQACMRNQFRIPLGFFDTMLLTRYWPESEDKKLVSLCDVAGVDIGTAHRALDDARAVAGFVSASVRRRAESRKKNA